MKVIYQFLLATLLFTACTKTFLDEPPLNVITEEQVFSSEQGIDAYIATLYDALPIEDFNYSSNNGFNNFPSDKFLSLSTDEMSSTYFVKDANKQIEDGTGLGWYVGGYRAIRTTLELIEKLGSATAVTDARKAELIAEARWMLAFDYFALVKRYGGVPLITGLQEFTGDNLDELKVPRNKEKDVWDYILDQLDQAIAGLPEAQSQSNAYRANKYVALALKSRAALHAACIAKYGSLNLDGLLGVPAANAAAYFQQSFDASKQIIEDGRYQLYRSNPDKSQNFAELFYKKSENSEVIFRKAFAYPSKTHSFDNWALPDAYRGYAGYGSGFTPTLNFVEEFEYIDGSDGVLKLTDGANHPLYYANTLDLFAGKDPRLAGTVILPGALWENQVQPGIVEVRAGVYYKGELVTSNNKLDEISFDDGTSMKIIGRSGMISGYAEETPTGFYIRKFLDPNPSTPDKWYNAWWSDVHWPEFRYAEILLNHAEASMELNRPEDALDAVNDIRDRAGIRLLTQVELTLDKVRHERGVELAFENKRYWDYIRWRVFENKISQYKEYALLPYYEKEENAYRFDTRQLPGPVKNFNTRAYYQRIEPAEINKNPNLEPNPGY